MKTRIFSIFVALFAIFLAACGGESEQIADDGYYHDNGADYTESIEHIEPTQSEPVALDFEPSIPLDIAANLLARVQAIWDEDDGALWGKRLDVPMFIADPLTRHAVANVPDPNGVHFMRYGDVYVGILPSWVFISHTSINFAGQYWGTAVWEPHMTDLSPEEEINFVRILFHEAFHALQNVWLRTQDNWPMDADQQMPHLNHSADSRIAVLLEMNALVAAVFSEGDERHRAVHDALSIRAFRRGLHGRVAAVSENAQEILEGLATFTEILTHDNAQCLVERFLPWMDSMATSTGISAFPYMTGMMYALLLQDSGANWQQDISFTTDLAALLQEALGITELTPFDQLDLGLWGYYDVADSERAWVENFAIMQQNAANFLSQPRITIGGDNHVDWDDYDTFLESFFVDRGNRTYLVLYGTFAYFGTNWQLNVTNGFVSPVWSPTGITIAFYDDIYICADGMTATAPTWMLEITDSAYLVELDDMGHIAIRAR